MLVGGLASGLVLADPAADVLPDDYELDLIDPDDQLSDDDVDEAITLAANDEVVAETLDGTESLDITVQATGNLTDVTVVFVGDADSIAATVDLQDERVTQVIERVSPASNAESLTVSAHTVESGETHTVQFSETDTATSAESGAIGGHEHDVSNIESGAVGETFVFNTTDTE